MPQPKTSAVVCALRPTRASGSCCATSWCGCWPSPAATPRCAVRSPMPPAARSTTRRHSTRVSAAPAGVWRCRSSASRSPTPGAGCAATRPPCSSVPAMFSFYFAALGEPFCSKAERADFDAVLGERLSRVSGGALEVARVRETIDDCARSGRRWRRSCGRRRSGALGPACHGVLVGRRGRRALTRGRWSICPACGPIRDSRDYPRYPRLR